jgi:hypothetical protein
MWLLSVCCAASPAQDQPPAPPAKPVEPVMTLELTDGSRIVGAAIELASLPLRADFGRVQIPLALIAHGQFASDRASLQVRFRNNDVLTGQLELETFKLRTPYGEATVPAKRVSRFSVQ